MEIEATTLEHVIELKQGNDTD